MDEQDKAPRDEHGAFSTWWMLKAALYWTDPRYLYTGVIEMLEYMMNEEEPVLEEAVDLLAQVALSGGYYPTREYGDDEERPIFRATMEKMSEEQIEEEALKFRDFLDGLKGSDDD